MLLTVRLCHLCTTLTKELAEGWVDDQFLGDRVTGQLPCELVLPASGLIVVLGVDDVVVIRLDLSVILLDHIGNTLSHVEGSC